MFNFNKDERGGKGYIILNVIRVFNIIALLTIVAASWVMLVMTVKTSSVSQEPDRRTFLLILHSSFSSMASHISSLTQSVFFLFYQRSTCSNHISPNGGHFSVMNLVLCHLVLLWSFLGSTSLVISTKKLLVLRIWAYLSGES